MFESNEMFNLQTEETIEAYLQNHKIIKEILTKQKEIKYIKMK
jgi:hypothetical protein